ncbi:MAG: hypothetical protein KAR40_11270 [Candidatus Sabulitectum sp.]|nr:hypothetical protein [Candidatus Sabulitectum sp.]
MSDFETHPAGTVAELQAENDALKAELSHWKANHADMVARCAMLRERPDLPADRIPQADRYRKEIEELRLHIAIAWGSKGQNATADILAAHDAAIEKRVIGDNISVLYSVDLSGLCNGSDETRDALIEVLRAKAEGVGS